MDNITIAIVNHGHDIHVDELLLSLERISFLGKIVLVNNISSEILVDSYNLSISVINNLRPNGFSVNNNIAFSLCDTEYFCVVNPDVCFTVCPFASLIHYSSSNTPSITSPLVLGSDGCIQDHMRRFPTGLSLLKKVFGWSTSEYRDVPFLKVDWVAGMFMFMESDVFRRLGGFDPSFFLYYEDIDLCLRARGLGIERVVITGVNVTHDARRSSHQLFSFFKLHIVSVLRFFTKHPALIWKC